MHHFEYVSKSKITPIKKELIQLICCVQNEVRNQFTFQYEFVGSVKRNMVTCDMGSNIGFDFDINILVNDDDEEYCAKDIKNILMRAFNKFAYKYRYDSREDSTRVFTIKVKDTKHSRVLHSCDFAVVKSCDDFRKKYIRLNKKSNIYTWEKQSSHYYSLPPKIEFCKDHSLWGIVRDTYIRKKNLNSDKNKKSRSIFAETINQVCQQNGYSDKPSKPEARTYKDDLIPSISCKAVCLSLY